MSYEEEKQDRKIERLEAEIERMRAELARVNQLRETEIDQAGAAERIYVEAARLKAARIEELRAELASANVELMAAGEIVMAAKQLRAEGKIGPDVMPRSWQITEERKEAFGRILRRLEYDQSLPGHTNYKIQRAMELLRAMLEGAGQ